MRVLVTGHKGQLGRAIFQRFAEYHDLVGIDLPEWDMTNPTQTTKIITEATPDVVIHTAALTKVDYCAAHPDEAVTINGFGTQNVALATEKSGARLISISSNEVFDGSLTGASFYAEYDQRNPINPYGYSKYVAEQVVERFTTNYMIVRTAWLYASDGINFLHKIIDRARQEMPLRVVTDEVSSPTYVNDLADALFALIEAGQPGIYHMTNAGACSRYQFAEAMLELAGLGHVNIEPITSDAFDRASTPPPNAPLKNVFGAALGVELRPWYDALSAFAEAEGLLAES